MDPSKVKVSGPGVKSGVRANIPQTFTVDCRKAGVAPLAVAVTSYRGVAEDLEVTDNGDGTHSVSYTPSVEGLYSVAVKYAEEDVPRRYKHFKDIKSDIMCLHIFCFCPEELVLSQHFSMVLCNDNLCT